MGSSSAGARALSSTRNSSTLRFAVAPPRLPQRWAQSTQDPRGAALERGAQRDRVKQWAIETLQNLDAYKEEDVLLSISEVQCFEPGCSPIDLVFSVLVEGGEIQGAQAPSRCHRGGRASRLHRSSSAIAVGLCIGRGEPMCVVEGFTLHTCSQHHNSIPVTPPVGALGLPTLSACRNR